MLKEKNNFLRLASQESGGSHFFLNGKEESLFDLAQQLNLSINEVLVFIDQILNEKNGTFTIKDLPKKSVWFSQQWLKKPW